MPNTHFKIPGIEPLFEWYFFNKREFPWRTQVYSDPHLWTYQTWICEVMSQQTLISVVLPKFKQFVEQLPDVIALANCPDELLRYLWSGLGYYARARNLRNGAKTILSEFQGQFPKSKQEWLKIPGCGEYTASIISSICYSQPVPAIDGNMIRVACRLLGLKDQVWEKQGQQKISEFMTNVMDYFSKKFKPGDINQAFMDFGSMVCKKQSPLCEGCPLKSSCSSFQNKTIDQCPPIKPRALPKLEQIFALAFVDKKTNSYLLVERDSGFLSKTMGFPLLAQKDGHSLEKIFQQAEKTSTKITTLEKTFKHQITHHKITGFVTLLEGSWDEKRISAFYEKISLSQKKHWIPISNLKKQLSSSLDQKVLKILS